MKKWPWTNEEIDIISDLYFLWKIYQRYTNDKSKINFEECLKVFEIRYFMNGKWNGQTKSEFDKNYKRVKDIVDKAGSDVDKMISLSKTQAIRITDEWKAINRAMAAKQMGHEQIFEIFFNRAYELGSVSKQEYREYKLEKLGF